jgi:hypothetical protein
LFIQMAKGQVSTLKARRSAVNKEMY